MRKKYVMVDLNDPRTTKLADIIGNKTCKKILEMLAENELSESELASKLGVPLTTVNYNVKKLVEAGFIEKTRTLWSSKGKRVAIYRTSNTRVVISPSPLKVSSGVLPALAVSAVGAAGVWMWAQGQAIESNLPVQGELMRVASESFAEANAAGATFASNASTVSDAAVASSGLKEASDLVISNALPDFWIWFSAGALVALTVIILWPFVKKLFSRQG